MNNTLTWIFLFFLPLNIFSQVKYDTIIDNCRFYCANDSINISYKGTSFYKSNEKISHWYYSETDDIEFFPRLIDIDCDGLNELVFTRYTRGTHCCFGLLIWTFKSDKPSLLFEHKDKDMGGYKMTDIDGDCALELVYSDDSWAYWKTDYSRSPSVGVGMKLISGHYKYHDFSSEVADSMSYYDRKKEKWETISDKEYLKTYNERVTRVKDLKGWTDHNLADLSEYWETILQLLEFGYTEEAYCFSVDAWNSSWLNYDSFMYKFCNNLYSSKHIGYLQMKNPSLKSFFNNSY